MLWFLNIDLSGSIRWTSEMGKDFWSICCTCSSLLGESALSFGAECWWKWPRNSLRVSPYIHDVKTHLSKEWAFEIGVRRLVHVSVSQRTQIWLRWKCWVMRGTEPNLCIKNDPLTWAFRPGSTSDMWDLWLNPEYSITDFMQFPPVVFLDYNLSPKKQPVVDALPLLRWVSVVLPLQH